MHAVVVGSDMNAQTKFETELRKFVEENNIQDRVHFVNKTLTVAPYLASIDVLVQNSQVLSGVKRFYHKYSQLHLPKPYSALLERARSNKAGSFVYEDKIMF